MSISSTNTECSPLRQPVPCMPIILIIVYGCSGFCLSFLSQNNKGPDYLHGASGRRTVLDAGGYCMHGKRPSVTDPCSIDMGLCQLARCFKLAMVTEVYATSCNLQN